MTDKQIKDKPIPNNNYERIKQMTVDEMANFLRDDILYHLPCKGSCYGCPDCCFACLKMMKQWLLAEVE